MQRDTKRKKHEKKSRDRGNASARQGMLRIASNYQKASLVAQTVKRLLTMRETWVRSLGREDSPGDGNGNLLQYSYLENPHGQRSLVGSSPRGCKESDMTERLHFQKI